MNKKTKEILNLNISRGKKEPVKRKFFTKTIKIVLGGALIIASLVSVIEHLNIVNSNDTELTDYTQAYIGGFSSEEVQKLTEIKRILDNEVYNTEISESELVENMAKSMIVSLGDPHSSYLTEEELSSFKDSQRGDYVGVGIIVQEYEDGSLKIINVFKESPAEEAGLQVGDLIIAVEGKPVKDEDMDITISKIRGKENTSVNLGIKRNNDITEIKSYRARIEIEVVTSDLKDDTVGYIHISGFNSNSYNNFVNAVLSLKEQGAESLIIDVRNNPGGLYIEVVKMLDYLLPPETLISYIQDRNGNKSKAFANFNGIDLPIVVLINEYSASASEILAGSLKDNDRAILVGVNTYGKGSVQQTRTLTDGSGVKITTGKFFTPYGKVIHGNGIAPDFEVSNAREEKEGEEMEYYEFQDLQLLKAIELLR